MQTLKKQEVDFDKKIKTQGKGHEDGIYIYSWQVFYCLFYLTVYMF